MKNENRRRRNCWGQVGCRWSSPATWWPPNEARPGAGWLGGRRLAGLAHHMLTCPQRDNDDDFFKISFRAQACRLAVGPCPLCGRQ